MNRSRTGGTSRNQNQRGLGGDQRGHAHAHSQSSQMNRSPFPKIKQRYKPGNKVVWGEYDAEVLRVMGDMLDITYPLSEFIMNRRKKTVHIDDVQVCSFLALMIG